VVKQPVIVWFRHVMRVADHPALLAAVATGQPVVPVFILDDEAAGSWKSGGARRWWLHESIKSLSADLRKRGSRLILRQGSTLDILPRLAKELDAITIFASRSYEPWARKQETHLQKTLEANGVELKRYAGALLFEPDAITTKAREPFKVFMPFWRAASQTTPRSPQQAPTKILAPGRHPPSDDLERWHLLPTKPDWAGGLRETWTPGEATAAELLGAFVDDPISRYATDRDRPDKIGTSRLSPYLAGGEISPSTCWHAAQARSSGKGSETFLKELIWREFCHHLLFHWPDLPEVPFREEFSRFPWSKGKAALRAWQRGLTGYPIVDAGMRELWHTGWMHNRVRMVTASFLTKHLLLPWQQGEAWFWDTLVDADLANNSANWQWVAGSGADAAPYFRIFNPVIQGERFDPDGDYVRRWVPELKALSNKHIHAPWTADDKALKSAKVSLGVTYPKPIVDHTVARQKALSAFASLKSTD
jgi:deoxyribodipyrimidine photo-lyase